MQIPQGENHEQKDQARRVGALGETPETGADSTRTPDPPGRLRLVPFVDVGGDDRLRDPPVGHLASHQLADHLAAGEDHDAIAEPLQLEPVRGNHQDRGAAL